MIRIKLFLLLSLSPLCVIHSGEATAQTPAERLDEYLSSGRIDCTASLNWKPFASRTGKSQGSAGNSSCATAKPGNLSYRNNQNRKLFVRN